MKFADLHTHTKLCNHASGEPEEYLAAAIAKNLAFFGVSDHFPAPAGYDAQFRMLPLEFPRYREIVRSLREKAAGTGTEVLYAVEFDYVPGRMHEVTEALEQEDFDYTIGSVHFTGNCPVDDPDRIDEVKHYGIDNLWEDYIELVCEFINGFPFQILGHVDLPKVFGFRHSDPKILALRMGSLFELAAEKNVMIELNTAGLRKPVREIYPSFDLLRLAQAAGVRITFGSDAHKPSDVGANFDDALRLAQAAGFRSAWAFRAGREIELPFD